MIALIISFAPTSLLFRCFRCMPESIEPATTLIRYNWIGGFQINNTFMLVLVEVDGSMGKHTAAIEVEKSRGRII